MKFEPIHIHKNKLQRGINILLLLLPALVFLITLLSFFLKYEKARVAIEKKIPSILGEGVWELDK